MRYQKIDKKAARRLRPSKIKEDQAIRKEIFERDNFTCQSCGIKPKDVPKNYDGRYTINVQRDHLIFESYLVIDHIIPWKKGGNIESCNLQTLCDPCNSSKGDRVNGL